MYKTIESLWVADPELAAEIETKLIEQKTPMPVGLQHMLVNETIWGLTIEKAFGQSLARAYLALAGKVGGRQIIRFRELVRRTGGSGPTQGRLMIGILVPLLLHADENCLQRFLVTLSILSSKGNYTLPPVVAALQFLLSEKDIDGAKAFLRLLNEIFHHSLTYNRSRHLAQIVPKTVCMLPIRGRADRIREVERIVNVDVDLTDEFMESFNKGLLYLRPVELSLFVSRGLAELSQNRTAGEKFLSMLSRQAQDFCKSLQVTVPLAQISNRLDRYLQARTGSRLNVVPLSAPGMTPLFSKGEPAGIVSDGRFIYLPMEMDVATTRTENEAIYQTLVRLEAAYFECGTFDFDLEKLMEKEELPDHIREKRSSFSGPTMPGEQIADLDRFFGFFQRPQLARNLFFVVEQGRIRLWLQRYYPGIARMSMPALRAEADRMEKAGESVEPLFSLYRVIAIGEKTGANHHQYVKRAMERFHQFMETDPVMGTEPSVEQSAVLVAEIYEGTEKLVCKNNDFRQLFPFRRQIRPDLFMERNGSHETKARRLQALLAERKIKVYRSDLRKMLRTHGGTISFDDIRSIAVLPREAAEELGSENNRRFHQKLSSMDFSEMMTESGVVMSPPALETAKAFRYREWDCRLRDYLQEHVIVREMPAVRETTDFFEVTRTKHRGLIKKIQHSFEMLKPQGLLLLRKWLEGDDFDYRALIEYVMDRKAGVMPSERLYVKRLKQQRDVSVLLLVDLSRSTANPVADGGVTVLDIEKEAIVLLCEALTVVGDRFSIAGFSGSGRLGVDYYQIKQFSEPMDETIRQRINAMAPRRSTRMGAAVRHAVSQLAVIPSRVRLLLLLGDGFPNDTGYKQNYAIEDTHRALVEARTQNIYSHGITVNFSSDTKLDQLYGKNHHHLIRDVRELPDKLFRIYGALTRQNQ